MPYFIFLVSAQIGLHPEKELRSTLFHSAFHSLSWQHHTYPLKYGTSLGEEKCMVAVCMLDQTNRPKEWRKNETKKSAKNRCSSHRNKPGLGGYTVPHLWFAISNFLTRNLVYRRIHTGWQQYQWHVPFQHRVQKEQCWETGALSYSRGKEALSTPTELKRWPDHKLTCSESGLKKMF